MLRSHIGLARSGFTIPCRLLQGEELPRVSGTRLVSVAIGSLRSDHDCPSHKRMQRAEIALCPRLDERVGIPILAIEGHAFQDRAVANARIGILLFKLTHRCLPVFVGCKAYTADLWFLFPTGGSAGPFRVEDRVEARREVGPTIRCPKQQIPRLLPPSGPA